MMASMRTLLCVCLLAAAVSACSDGWDFFFDSCYKIINERGHFRTFDGAAENCTVEYSALLTSVRSQDEMDFIFGLMDDASVKRMWIGMHMFTSGANWVDGRLDSGYRHFADGGYTQGDDGCSMVRKHDWYIDPCHSNAAFLCRHNVEQSNNAEDVEAEVDRATEAHVEQSGNEEVPIPDVGGCVSSCTGVNNGDYQSCDTCNGFVTCSNNILYNMPCAPASPQLVWDDSIKRCEYKSSTCHGGDYVDEHVSVYVGRPEYIQADVVRASGSGVQDGELYLGSHVARASDDGHESELALATESLMPTEEGHLPEVDLSEVVPVEQSNNAGELELEEDRPTEAHVEQSANEVAPVPEVGHPADVLVGRPPWGRCVRSCVGVENGNYQSCDTCNGYVACSNGLHYDMPCPANLVWDDVKDICDYTSSTCKNTTMVTDEPVH